MNRRQLFAGFAIALSFGSQQSRAESIRAITPEGANRFLLAEQGRVYSGFTAHLPASLIDDLRSAETEP